MSLLESFERYSLTFGPTPVEPLPRLSEALGGAVEIYAKREDCNSGLALGGNKLRKLEYIVPDAIASGADTLVSIGGVQSNHTRMVAATAAKIGMKCVVVQEKWVPHFDGVYDRVGNIMLTRLMGADSRLVDGGFDIGIRQSWEDAIQSVRDAGGTPYAIPAGASVHKFGALGYIGFAEELATQEQALGFTLRLHRRVRCHWFDAGRNDCRFRGPGPGGPCVIGIDASGTIEQTRAQVRSIVDNTAELVGLGRSIREDEIVINPDYAYPAYGVPSEETNAAIRLGARTEAMITDPVYEGKSLQGLIDLTKKGFFPAGSKVLYAHLGGAPALNGYSYYYKDG